MAKQTINIGTTANDGTGDPIRAAFGKVNDNFTEIYTANTGVNTGDQNLSAYATTAAVAAGYQPLDSDLTAISALTTTAYGRALLSTADAATLRSAIGVGTTDAPTFLAQTLTGQSLTGTQATNLLDLATTWDTTGTPTAIKVNATNTNSNPATKFIDLQLSTVSKFKVGKGGNIFSGANITTGDGSAGAAGPSLEMVFANYGIGIDANGNAQFLLNGTAKSRVGFGVCIASDQALLFSDLTHTGTNAVPDVFLRRDGAPGILAQRNGSSAPQAFRVYNAHYGTTSDEWGAFDWKTSSNSLLIGTQRPIGGTSTRNVNIVSTAQVLLTSGSGYSIDFAPGGTTRWHIHTPGNLWATTDNAYDIGASGANRPRTIYVGTSVISSGVSSFEGVNLKASGGSVRLTSPAYGVMSLLDSDGTGNFTRINIGGTTSAFPAIKRNGTGIDIVLADDSGLAGLSCALFNAAGIVNAAGSRILWAGRSAFSSPSDGVVRVTNNGSTGFTRLELGEADMGIMRGAGTPESAVTAKVGSIFLRTDGGASTTLYVKESGTGNTGWVAK